MKLNRLNDIVYYSDCDHSVDRPVLGYILGKDFSVMVDAGNSKQHVAAFYQLLKNYHLPFPKYCVLTHWHWDHTFGLHALACDSIAHCNTAKELNRMMEWQWNDEAMKQRLIQKEEIEFADLHIRKEYTSLDEIKVVNATMYIEKQLIMDCGEVHCQCIHLPSAHSDDSLVVLIPEARVIFLGDIYNDDFYRDHVRDIEKTKALCQALKEMDFDYAIPGHSEPLPKEKLIAFLERFS